MRRIKRGISGKGIRLDDLPENLIEHTIESWWEYLLCADCEERLGKLDHAGIEFLRAVRKQMRKPDEGILCGLPDYASLKRRLVGWGP